MASFAPVAVAGVAIGMTSLGGGPSPLEGVIGMTAAAGAVAGEVCAWKTFTKGSTLLPNIGVDFKEEAVAAALLMTLVPGTLIALAGTGPTVQFIRSRVIQLEEGFKAQPAASLLPAGTKVGFSDDYAPPFTPVFG
ncbi:MAG: hypothetical protein LRY54_00605 [Alphaproteobacteria bacterium]|nr:hypothetical protein [Alphaproteobacteria bacterium]